ncbi:VOC family protein, partial [Streptomyces lasiicapitis]|uniref:VOC family protein n=1 Tax=Streptomyces lasiicapitis TaxID=1923961 RepID=UPI0036A147E0
MRVIAFDHLVLSVADIERSLAFYTGPLGLETVRVEEWRARKVPIPAARGSPTPHNAR